MPETCGSDPRSVRSRWFAAVAVIGASLLVLLLLELGVRLTHAGGKLAALPNFGQSADRQQRLFWHRWQADPDRYGTTSYPSSFDEVDPVLGWRVRPGADVRHVRPGMYDVRVRTNRFGLRGTAPSTRSGAPATLRVGVFGCSQTFGETVNDDEVFVERLDRRFGPQVEFLNFGVRGYGTDQMLLYQESVAGEFGLDVVVLAFAFYHMERNARSFLFYAKPYFELDAGLEPSLRGVPVPAPGELLAHPAQPGDWPLADRSAFLRWSWARLRRWQDRRIYDPGGRVWNLTAALLGRFADNARAEGSEFVLLNVDEAHPELEPALAGLADRLEVRLLDLGPLLREAAANSGDTTLDGDNHWTGAGHEVVSGALGAFLCKERLVPCGAAEHDTVEIGG